jgi:ABC-type antimicrobial peptide transport system permease subunit
MAVGATPRNVLALVFQQGFTAGAIGFGIGLAAALVSTHFLRSFIPGLEPGNPAPIWIAAGLVALTAGIACWIPARRATRIDPMSALRQE